MVRRTVLLLGLMSFSFFVCGCSTIYQGTKGAADGIKTGAKQDWEDLNKADDWMRKNYW